MSTVHLGNPRPIFNGEPVDDQAAVTRVVIRDGKTLRESLLDIVHNDGTPNTGLWPQHSAASSPSWVESDDPQLAQAIATHYGCPIGRPNENATDVSEEQE